MKRINFMFLSFVLCLNVNAQWANWIKQNSNVVGTNKEIFDFSIVNENIVWAPVCEYSGKYPIANQEFVKTTNGGTTWTLYTINNAPNQAFSNIFALDENKAWAAMFSFNGGGYIYKTTNGGVTWMVTDSSMFKGGFPDFVHFFNSNDGVCVGDPNGGYYEIYTTNNGGVNWNRVPQTNIPNPILSEGGISNVYNAVKDTIWFGTINGRIFKSTDKGNTWSVQALFPEHTSIISIAFKDGSNGLVAPDSWDSLMYISKYSFGLKEVTSGSYGSKLKYVKSDGIYPGMYISGGYSFNIGSISKDDGANWITIDTLSHACYGFVNSSIGWTGACNKNENVADIYRYIPSTLNATQTITNRNYEVLIFPNPAQDIINIKSEYEIKSVDIYSIDGKLLMHHSNNRNQLKLNVDKLENGMYLIKIYSKSGNYSQKVVVKK